ncbi:MAG: PAS domain-containing protein [Brumimicrobium sp.]
MQLDENWEFTYFNKKAERLLKKKSKYVRGENIWEIFLAAEGTALETKYRAVALKKVALCFEYLYPTNCISFKSRSDLLFQKHHSKKERKKERKPI